MNSAKNAQIAIIHGNVFYKNTILSISYIC